MLYTDDIYCDCGSFCGNLDMPKSVLSFNFHFNDFVILQKRSLFLSSRFAGTRPFKWNVPEWEMQVTNS
jgi:hypothetical protein